MVPSLPYPAVRAKEERVPGVHRLLADLGLLGSTKGRNHHPGCCTSSAHCMGHSSPRHAVQELHRHLALVMEKGNWINMEKEIWDEAI